MDIRNTLLMAGIRNDSPFIVDIALFLGANPNHTEQDKYLPEKTSALKDALQYVGKNSEKIAFKLIDKGARINLPEIKENLLYTAVQHYDNPHLVDVMVKNGGDLMRGSGVFGRPPMLEALAVGHFKAAQKLLDFGTPLDITDAIGKTALMESTTHNQHDVMEYLLSNGADVHKKDNFGETVAHYAVKAIGLKQSKTKQQNALKTLWMLKTAGANFFEPNKKGETAFVQARNTKVADAPEFRPFFNKLFQETSIEWRKSDAEQRQIRADYAKRKQKGRD
jgi:ankyrin repeat protein